MGKYDAYNQLSGTIGASGSLTRIIDTEGFALHGLILRPTSGSGTMVAGTVQFRVGIAAGTVYPLVDASNVRVGFPNGTSALAYSWIALQCLRPYRYVQVETSANQTQSVDVILPVKLS